MVLRYRGSVPADPAAASLWAPAPCLLFSMAHRRVFGKICEVGPPGLFPVDGSSRPYRSEGRPCHINVGRLNLSVACACLSARDFPPDRCAGSVVAAVREGACGLWRGAPSRACPCPASGSCRCLVHRGGEARACCVHAAWVALGAARPMSPFFSPCPRETDLGLSVPGRRHRLAQVGP